MSIKAKKCPICDSAELQYVYYAPSAKDEPALWEDILGLEYHPMILLRRIECKKCGATVSWLTMTRDNALSRWNNVDPKLNHRPVLQRIGVEDVSEVEE